MAQVRYFAAVEEIVGLAEERRAEHTVEALRSALVTEHPKLVGVLERCALLVDGRRVDDETPLTDATRVDVLPPFAGG